MKKHPYMIAAAALALALLWQRRTGAQTVGGAQSEACKKGWYYDEAGRIVINICGE